MKSKRKKQNLTNMANPLYTYSAVIEQTTGDPVVIVNNNTFPVEFTWYRVEAGRYSNAGGTGTEGLFPTGKTHIYLSHPTKIMGIIPTSEDFKVFAKEIAESEVSLYTLHRNGEINFETQEYDFTWRQADGVIQDVHAVQIRIEVYP